ncbi:MAG: ATP-binding protein, partial [Thermoguttaceae bacterium]
QANDDIYYAYVINNDGFIPAHTDQRKSKTKINLPDPGSPGRNPRGKSHDLLVKNEDGHKFREFHAPILVEGQPWGEFCVGIPAALANNRGRENAASTFFITIFFSLVIVGVMVCLIRYSLRPLRGLTRATRQMAAGNVSARCDYSRNDELGALAQSFNAMADTIAQTQEGLERQVQERTAQLAAANQGMLIEIAERKRAEEELHQYAAALQSANKALEESNQLVESATRAKSEFLANMSHEIRTPMTAILGYADLLLEEAGLEKAPERRRNAFATIKRNGEHLLELINDILDLSKVEAGKVLIEPIRCSPLQLLTDLVSLMCVRADAKQLKLEANVVGPLPETILTDPLRFRQVLVNLVGNAIKFTDQGDIRITARLASDDGHPRLRFDVTDTGIGMSEEQIGKLFQPFSQVDSSAARKFGGTGLGLCLSKRLTEAMGGKIEVRSVLGKGSTFSFTIDPGQLEGIRMIDNSQTNLLDRAPATAPDKIKLDGRVLLAEDGPDNLYLISAFLKDAGADVTAVENGQFAVESVLAAHKTVRPFDAILMDMQMPVMDGYAATRKLRASGYTIPIIALTAHAMVEDCQKCLDAGCNDYATKPIDWKKLLAMLARWMARASTDRRAAQSDIPVSVASQSEETLQSAFADNPVIARILPQFLGCLDDRVQAMDAALANGQLEELCRLAHQIKGAGGSYGFPSISEAATTLEFDAREGQRDAATASLAKVSALCRAAVHGWKPQDRDPAHSTALQQVP